MNTEPTIMAIVPHPDDEAYAMGGTLALCAAAGARVVVVSATRGGAGRLRHGSLAPGETLSHRRSDELADSCAALGTCAPCFLDWPDGGVDALEPAAAEATLRELIAAEGPAVVLTLGRDGVYGHRDHLALTELVAGAVTGQRLLEVAFPRDLFRPVFQRLRRAPGRVVVPGPLGVTRAEVDLVVDITAVAHRKRAALEAHASQLVGGRWETFLLPGLTEALATEEWWVLRRGPPLPAGAKDPLAGL